MVGDREIYVIRESESGDYFLVPLAYADQFWEDEIEGNATYAEYFNLHDLQIYDYEV